MTLPKDLAATSSLLPRLLCALAGGLLLVVFLKNAWVCEDAYINFRSLDQLFAGNGPIWNPHARVQVYTSVLWYWLSAALALVYRDFFIAVLALSALCCGLAAWFTRRHIPQGGALLLLSFIVVTSRSIADYSSSGLENPLAYVLVTAFIYYSFVTFRTAAKEDKQNYFDRLCWITGLAPLIRHDLLILLLIPFAYLAWVSVKTAAIRFSIRQVAYLAVPLSLWSGFSLLYYGYLFPNTAYAKLNTGVPREALIERGLGFFQAHLLWDPVVLLILVIACSLWIVSRNRLCKAMSLGLCSYLGYLVYIGSDYMLGRFLAVPGLYGLLLLVNPVNASLHNNRLLVLVAALSLVMTISNGRDGPLLTTTHWGFRKGDIPMPILDNFDVRFGEYPHNSLWKYAGNNTKNSLTSHNWCQKGLLARKSATAVRGPIGMFGFCAGRDIIIIDSWAITDPLLSRLPGEPGHWRPGHFTRSIPEGYQDSLLKNDNLITDPTLKAYYDVIRQITEAKPLFSISRLEAIVKMNLGFYHPFVETPPHASH